jgi:hypothetical protein
MFPRPNKITRELIPQWSSIGKSKTQSHIGLELSRVVVAAIGLVTPIANGIRRGPGQDWVSAESADIRDGTLFGYLDFKNYFAGAMGG